jgi:glycosyltransferase involved in cell wall biosynthesis
MDGARPRSNARKLDTMKIGFLCSDIDIPLFGDEGCSIHVRDFTDALVDSGHDVFIVCPSLGESMIAGIKSSLYHLQPRGLDALGWSLVEQEPIIQNQQLERDLRSVAYNFWLQSEGSSIIEREKPDVLYERYSLFGWGGIELARRHRIPLMLEVNDPLCREQAGYEKFTLTATAERMESEIIRGADAVIAISKWIQNWVISLGVNEQDVHIVPNGVSLKLFAERQNGETVRQRYNLGKERLIGFLGSFQPWHDVEGLLRAFSKLYADDHNLRLLLVGDGQQREALEETVRQLGLGAGVIFTGNIPHDSVPEYLAAMDVAVAPYNWKEDFYGSPLKIFEYMAAGKPTVAAAIGQIEEVIEHGKTGWLYPSGDHEQLAHGLASLLYSPELSSAISNAAREKILSDHTWKAIATRVTALAGVLLEDKIGAETNLAQRR